MLARSPDAPPPSADAPASPYPAAFPPSDRLAAIVLTGGTGARLGGVDKASLRVGGLSLLERAIRATAAAGQIVVVGTPVPTPRPVTWAREDPPGGGPAAGMLAGLDAIYEHPALVCVLAVDMPRVTAVTFSRLVAALDADLGCDGAVLVATDGHRQTLAGVYRRDALLAVRPARRSNESGLSMRALLAPLRLLDVPSIAGEDRDVDTWADLLDLAGEAAASSEPTLER